MMRCALADIGTVAIAANTAKETNHCFTAHSPLVASPPAIESRSQLIGRLAQIAYFVSKLHRMCEAGRSGRLQLLKKIRARPVGWAARAFEEVAGGRGKPPPDNRRQADQGLMPIEGEQDQARSRVTFERSR